MESKGQEITEFICDLQSIATPAIILHDVLLPDIILRRIDRRSGRTIGFRSTEPNCVASNVSQQTDFNCFVVLLSFSQSAFKTAKMVKNDPGSELDYEFDDAESENGSMEYDRSNDLFCDEIIEYDEVDGITIDFNESKPVSDADSAYERDLEATISESEEEMIFEETEPAK